jgi:hypothetical protein
VKSTKSISREKSSVGALKTWTLTPHVLIFSAHLGLEEEEENKWHDIALAGFAASLAQGSKPVSK